MMVLLDIGALIDTALKEKKRFVTMPAYVNMAFPQCVSACAKLQGSIDIEKLTYRLKGSISLQF